MPFSKLKAYPAQRRQAENSGLRRCDQNIRAQSHRTRSQELFQARWLCVKLTVGSALARCALTAAPLRSLVFISFPSRSCSPWPSPLNRQAVAWNPIHERFNACPPLPAALSDDEATRHSPDAFDFEQPEQIKSPSQTGRGANSIAHARCVGALRPNARRDSTATKRNGRRRHLRRFRPRRPCRQ